MKTKLLFNNIKGHVGIGMAKTFLEAKEKLTFDRVKCLQPRNIGPLSKDIQK